METLKQLIRVAVVVLLLATTTSFVFWLKRSATSIEQHHLPHITIASVDVTGISSERVNMLADVQFDNNESAGITIDSIDYTIYLEGEHIIAKTYKQVMDIKPAAQASVELPVNLYFEKLNPLFKELHKAGKDSAQMKVSMVLYSKRIPSGSKKMHVTKNVPVVSMPGMHVQKMELERSSKAGNILNVVMLVRNTNAEPFLYKNVECNVAFKEYKNIDVQLKHVIKIPAHGSVRVVVPVNLTEQDARYLLAKGKDVRYVVKMSASANTKAFKDNKLSMRAYGKTQLVQEINYEM